ncbi:phage tail tape measure protein [Holdemania massiliensis]|uniref:Phage tail tape measure protein n=1 Tax=Holdemania massiliensis TaxID=1468449 RepID=A0A6N7S6K2_9FIRM|nr:phage tail tape measure protein [Holdemania massiliensis]MSA70949.1 phage tail tape measure protein [Holdemania massiliensis]MSA89275.1 phage tail tape measure protein [Holdemania massiliensis]MSB78028.1 phage tail tape measure protein [Holdemania massiliensis]MSC32953.1 phage tail tape measure protein [Holdemania massiliensis]MSC39350.1 phage tail tape measure protein [Holdemania massiliensis]
MSRADGSIIIDTKIDQSGLDRGISTLTKTLAAGVGTATTAIAGLSAAVVNVGSKFETSTAKASTLFADTAVKTDVLNDRILKLSSSSGLAADTIGNSLYNALSAGIPVTEDMGDAMDYMEKNAKLAKAGFTDIDTAVTATAKVLNAYKMDVSETDKIHKILMATQNKGITTVGELGSVLAQVTPTAAAMSVSFEQVGAALATMTAQGKPTAQATTQLNSLFAELGKSGTQASVALDEATKNTDYAGKSFQDLMAAGVPLNEVLDLMDDYAKDNNKSLLDMFSSIEAGKAALSMAGKNAEQYTSNLNAMSTSTDLVGEAYEKMSDTFEDKSRVMGESLKNVGIQAYEKFKEPLKDAMEGSISEVDKLSKEMSSGKLSKSVDTIAGAFSGLLKELVKLAGEWIPKMIDGFAWVIDHGKPIAGIVTGMTTAVVAFKAANKLDSTMVAWKKLKNALSGYLLTSKGATVAEGVHNGLISTKTALLGSATIKQLALNAAQLASPHMWLIAGIGALAVSIGALVANYDKGNTAVQDMNKSLKDEKQRWDELKAAQEEKLTTDLSQIDYTQRLYNELQTLVDAEGNVTGSKERVKYITDKINEQYPDTIKFIEDEKGAYIDAAGELQNLMELKKAEILLNSMEDQFAEALKNRSQAIKDVATSQQQLNDAQVTYDEALAAYNENPDSYTNQVAVNKAQSALTMAQDNLQLSQDMYNQSVTVIAEYETLSEGIQSKNMETVNEYLNGVSSMINATAEFSTENHEALLKQYEDESAQCESLLQLLEQTNSDKIKKQIEADLQEAEQRRKHAAEQLEQSTLDAQALGMATVEGEIEGIQAKQPTLDELRRVQNQSRVQATSTAVEDEKNVLDTGVSDKAAIEEAGYDQSLIDQSDYIAEKTDAAEVAHEEEVIRSDEMQEEKVEQDQEHYDEDAEKLHEQLANLKKIAEEEAPPVGRAISDGMAEGIRQGRSGVINAAIEVAVAAINAAKAALDSHSPSKVMAQVGRDYDRGLVVGIEEEQQQVASAARISAESMVSAAQNAVLASQSMLGQHLTFGLSGTAQNNRGGADPASIQQIININQPCKSAVETAREIRRASRDLVKV